MSYPPCRKLAVQACTGAGTRGRALFRYLATRCFHPRSPTEGVYVSLQRALTLSYEGILASQHRVDGRKRRMPASLRSDAPVGRTRAP